MRRLGPLLGATAVAGVAGSLIVGSPTLSLVFVPMLGGVAFWARRTRRGDSADHPWSAQGAVRTPSHLPVDPVTPPPTRRVISALARVEARELIVNPWLGVGIGFCVVMVIAFAAASDVPYDANESWEDVIRDLPFLAHPLVGMAVLASHRAATRAERDGTGELFESCPTTGTTRAFGALAAAWIPVAVLAAFFAAFLLGVEVSSPDGRGPVGSTAVATLFAGLVLGAGGVALGVALGRWVRFALSPVVAIVVVGFVSLRLADNNSDVFSPQLLLSTLPPLADPAPVLTAGQAWAHVAWLVAITAAVAVVAVAQPARRAWSH